MLEVDYIVFCGCVNTSMEMALCVPQGIFPFYQSTGCGLNNLLRLSVSLSLPS